MIYDNHLPSSVTKRQVFTARGSTNDWQVWNKPHNCKFVHIFCLGGGGGGGSGQGAAVSTARRGGGGGGSGAYVNALFPATYLPDTIYLQVGPGGVGGSSGNNGATGSISYVSIQPNTTAANILLQSGSVAARGGVSGATNPSTGGAASTIWVEASTNILVFGLIVPVAGQAGGTGISLSAPTDTTISGILTGGAAGAGTNGATSIKGANITGTGSVPTIVGGPAGGSAGSTATGGAGSTFITCYPSESTTYSIDNFFLAGGSGGGSSDGGAGGAGGNAIYGGGGGGGGAGITNNGGPGGKGGDGLIIITCI